MIRTWTDSWVSRLGLMLSPEEEMKTIALQIEAQHYFQPMIEKLREEPDGTFFSDLVNMEVPGWGRPLNDNEIHAHLMGDTFVGGGETTSNSFAGGMRMLLEHRDVWEQLKADPDRYLKNFVEELLRIESPVQGLTRFAAKDVELAGVKIAAGSTIGVQYAAANRDPERFPEPEKFDLERKNAGAHMAFGSGVHFCVGAMLARREMYSAIDRTLARMKNIRLTRPLPDPVHQPSLFFLPIKEMYLGFDTV